MVDEKLLDISWKTIFKISLAVLAFYIIYQIKDILIWFVFALIISILFNLPVNFLEKKRIPRLLATIFVYAGILGIFVFLVYLIIPLFVYEIQQFLEVFPQYFEKFSPFLEGLGLKAFENFGTFINALKKILEKMSADIFSTLFAVFGGFFSTVFTITLAFIFSLEEKEVKKFFKFCFPQKKDDCDIDLWERSQKKIIGWFETRIIASLFVGALSFIVFLIFNVKYSAVLGFLSALLNFVPIIGPFITGILIFLIGAMESLKLAVFLVFIFTLIQQVENNILTPLLTKKTIGMSPILVVLALAIGGKMAGLLGAILIIPLFGILFEFGKEYLQQNKEKTIIL